MVGVVSGERDELVAYGHDANGSVGAGTGSTPRVVEVSGLASCVHWVIGSLEESLAEWFSRFCVPSGWEAVGGFGGIWGFRCRRGPVEDGLLPEKTGVCPHFGVDGEGDVREFAVDEVVAEESRQGCERVRRRSAFGDEGLGQFHVHGISLDLRRCELPATSNPPGLRRVSI